MQRRFLLPVLAFILPVGGAVAAPMAIEEADYRGSETVLARTGDYVVTEQELLIFSLMLETANPRDVKGWQTLPEATKGTLRSYTHALLQTQYISDIPSTYTLNMDPTEIEFRDRAERIVASPAANWIWADTVVRNTVTIFPEDIVQAYLQRPADYATAPSVVVRRLRVPIEQPLTLETQNTATRRAAELRERAESEGGLRKLLEEFPELIVDPSGNTFELTRENREVDEEIRETAFQLGIGQISRPIRTPGSIFLIEVVDRIEPAPRPVEEVRARIEEGLIARFIPQQFDYLAGQTARDMYPTNNSRLFTFIPGDADLIRVGNFALQKDEFARIYSDRLYLMPRISMDFIQSRAEQILLGEVTTQDLEAKGLLPDPFHEAAKELAREVINSREYTRNKRREINPRDPEVAEFLDQHMEEVAPGIARTVWKLEVFLRNAESLPEREIDALSILMRTYIASLIRDAQRQFDERLQLAAGRALLEPDKILQLLQQPDDSRIRVQFTRVGPVTQRDSMTLTGLPFERLTVGQFTEPSLFPQARVASFFVTEETAAPPIDRAELLLRARQALVEKIILADVTKWFDEQLAAGKVEYHPDFAPPSEAPAAAGN
jgi:hypothetical protein